MHRIALIYNPASGQNPNRRAAIIGQIRKLFEQAGLEVTVIGTSSPQDAGVLAEKAIEQGCDTVIACGGDGTVHECLQHMVGGPGVLGVIPLGTANALAADLGLPTAPVKAAKRLLTAKPVRVAAGRVWFQDAGNTEQSRYFLVAAGVGVDAFFFSRLDSRMKQRFGYLAYLVDALRLWAQYSFPLFSATLAPMNGEAARVEQLSQLLAVRIGNFGGLVRRLVPGAALGNPHLSVVAIKTRSRLRYLKFMTQVWFARHTYAPPIELVECTSVECRELDGVDPRTFVEADGELLGSLPARIEVVPEAITLLVPEKITPSR